MSAAKVLVFGFGNPGRGDDGLGPLFASEIEKLGLAGIACQTDMQLQVEHIVDMQGRDMVLFIDADVSCEAPFEFGELESEKDSSYTSHAMTPQAIMHSYSSVLKERPPRTFLLRIRGERFDLGDELSSSALRHMEASRIFVLQFLREMNIGC
ncbi:MAG: hydrogenase maturation protease [Mariprofundaceae bacterium]|nr:hydrogenase maturation protease [Mariprofundaceae bacterium]